MKGVLRVAVLMVVLLAATCGTWAQGVFSPDHLGEVNLGEVKFRTRKVGSLRFQNKGDRPLQIDSIVPSCGCTEVQLRGDNPLDTLGEAFIDIVYRGDMLGFFERSIEVYSGGQSKPYTIYFSGRVVTDFVGTVDDFPYDLGNVRMSEDMLDFGVLRRGDWAERKLHIFNVSTTPYRPTFNQLPDYLLAISEPEVLAPQRPGVVTFTLNSDKLPELGPRQDVFYLGGYKEHVQTEGGIRCKSLLIQDFSHLTKEQRLNAPQVEVSDTALTIGTWEKTKVQKRTVVISNTGKTPLEIRSLQVTNRQVSSLKLNRSIIKPGKKARLKVVARAEDVGKDDGLPCQILFLTNSPSAPVVFINVDFLKDGQ